MSRKMRTLMTAAEICSSQWARNAKTTLSVLPRKRKLSRLCCAAVSEMEIKVRVPMANASPSDTSWFIR
jgi:hypothetical protein